MSNQIHPISLNRAKVIKAQKNGNLINKAEEHFQVFLNQMDF